MDKIECQRSAGNTGSDHETIDFFVRLGGLEGMVVLLLLCACGKVRHESGRSWQAAEGYHKECKRIQTEALSGVTTVRVTRRFLHCAFESSVVFE